MTRKNAQLDQITGQEIARRCEDAHMADTYGEAEWAKCATELLAQGLTVKETEAFLRSKHMRWAEDMTEQPTAAGLRQYLRTTRDLRGGLKNEARLLVLDR